MTNQSSDKGRQVGGKKTSEVGKGDPNKASPVAIERHLKGIKFPAEKADLIKLAKQNNAPDDVMNVLERFEDREYSSVADVAKEVGVVE